MQTVKIFLASSAELKDERDQFEIAICRKNKDWVRRGVFLELIMWEDFLDAISLTRLQDEYNKTIRDCDIFVMLFWSKVGKYTEEEFDVAFQQFQSTHKPFMFTYFKDAPNPGSSLADAASLTAFRAKLDALGHYCPSYNTSDTLQNHFTQQLEKLAANGFIEFKRDDAAAVPGGTVCNAKLAGDGAIAQAGGIALGAGAIYNRGDNNGILNTGTISIGGNAFTQTHGAKLGKGG